MDQQGHSYTYLDLVKTPKLRRLTLFTGIVWWVFLCTILLFLELKKVLLFSEYVEAMSLHSSSIFVGMELLLRTTASA